MAENSKKKLTLDRPAMYQVKVPAHLDANWLDWVDEMMIETGRDEDEQPITTLTVSLDQAALIGLLRRLYSLGLPLISVQYLEEG